MIYREENPANVTRADIVIGIPSYQEADSISFPVRQASIGIKKYFPDKAAVIINCDNHSPDGTEGVFFDTKTEIEKIYITTPPNTKGKGHNLKNLFRKTLDLGAKTLVCLDADLTSITPEWIKYFCEPVRDGFDYVSPEYARNKYDGTITNTICFPLIYSLFCCNIRQPISGDFAVSEKLIRRLLQESWCDTTVNYGIDIFVSINAVTNGFRICKIGLGAKQHKPSGPKLELMFPQVVNTAFELVINYLPVWKDLLDVYEPPFFSCQDPQPSNDIEVDRASIREKARKDFLRYKTDLKNAINEKSFSELEKMFSSGTINISSELWTDIVFEVIPAYARSNDREPITKALRGLYFGRVLTFINETWNLTQEETEHEVFLQARSFHAKRNDLAQKLEAVQNQTLHNQPNP